MKTFEIYVRDLKDDVRAEFEAEFGTEQENNWDIVPIAIFEREDGED